MLCDQINKCRMLAVMDGKLCPVFCLPDRPPHACLFDTVLGKDETKKLGEDFTRLDIEVTCRYCGTKHRLAECDIYTGIEIREKKLVKMDDFTCPECKKTLTYRELFWAIITGPWGITPVGFWYFNEGYQVFEK